MLKRTANVSMVHLAGLAGLESGIRDSFGIEVGQYHDKVVYHALIQAGVHSIRRIDGMSSDLPSLVGKERITAYDGTEYYNMLHSIQEMLQKHAIGGIPGKEQR